MKARGMGWVFLLYQRLRLGRRCNWCCQDATPGWYFPTIQHCSLPPQPTPRTPWLLFRWWSCRTTALRCPQFEVVRWQCQSDQHSPPENTMKLASQVWVSVAAAVVWRMSHAMAPTCSPPPQNDPRHLPLVDTICTRCQPMWKNNSLCEIPRVTTPDTADCCRFTTGGYGLTRPVTCKIKLHAQPTCATGFTSLHFTPLCQFRSYYKMSIPHTPPQHQTSSKARNLLSQLLPWEVLTSKFHVSLAAPDDVQHMFCNLLSEPTHEKVARKINTASTFTWPDMPSHMKETPCTTHQRHSIHSILPSPLCQCPQNAISHLGGGLVLWDRRDWHFAITSTPHIIPLLPHNMSTLAQFLSLADWAYSSDKQKATRKMNATANHTCVHIWEGQEHRNQLILKCQLTMILAPFGLQWALHRKFAATRDCSPE